MAKKVDLSHRQVAALQLSGSTILVGQYNHAEGDSVYIKTDESYENIYMSRKEAKLFMAALDVAIDRDY